MHPTTPLSPALPPSSSSGEASPYQSINDLPEELLVYIFSCLSLQSLNSARRVCKKWRSVSQGKKGVLLDRLRKAWTRALGADIPMLSLETAPLSKSSSPIPSPNLVFEAKLRLRLRLCLPRERDVVGEIVAHLHLNRAQYTEAERQALRGLFPRLIPFANLFQEHREELLSLPKVPRNHRSLRQCRSLISALQETHKRAKTPALRRDLQALSRHYETELQRLLQTKDRKKLLKPKAQIWWEGYWLIDESLARQILSCNEDGKIERYNDCGSRAVVPFGGAHFKVNPDDETSIPASPQMEYAITSLCHLLCPNKMTAAPTTIINVRKSGRLPGALIQVGYTVGSTKGPKPTGILLNELFDALNLFDWIKNKGTFAEFEKRWDDLLVWASSPPSFKPSYEELLKDYLAFMKGLPEKQRCKEFSDAFIKRRWSFQLGEFGNLVDKKSLGQARKLLSLFQKKTILPGGQSLWTLLRLPKSLQWIQQLMPGASCEEIYTKFPNLLKQVDREALSGLFVASLLVNPSDGKADNYMVAIDWKRTSNGERVKSLRIVGIDNDMAFGMVPSMKGKGMVSRPVEWRGKQRSLQLNIRCLLYALPPGLLKESIHTTIHQRLQTHPPEQLFFQWIQRLDAQNQIYKQLTQSHVVAKHKIDLRFPQEALPSVYQKLCKLHSLFQTKGVTLRQAFEGVDPVLFHCYQRASHGRNPNEALRALDRQKSGLSLQELLKGTFITVDYKGKRTALLEALKQLANTQADGWEALAQATQSVLNKLDLAPSNQQLSFFKPLSELSFFSDLKLNPSTAQRLLDYSLENDDASLLRHSLHAGADPNAKDASGDTPLHRLCCSLRLKLRVFRALIKAPNIDPNLPNERGFPPLFYLVQRLEREPRFKPYLRALVRLKADLEWQMPALRTTYLDFAIQSDRPQTFMTLIFHGAGRTVNAPQALRYALDHLTITGMTHALKRLETQCPRVGWLQDLPAMCTPKPCPGSFTMTGANHGKLELHPKVVAMIGIKDGLFPPKEENQYGRHTIKLISYQERELAFKEKPEMAGNEFLVGSLHQRLIRHGTPQTELFRCSPNPDGSDPYPVLVSQKIEGPNFRDIFYAKNASKQLARLDRHRLHNMMLMAIVTNPEDGKSENYIYSPLGDDKAQVFCVDNDHAFVNPFDGGKLLVKCVLFCLDQMQDRIDPLTRKIFLNLDLEKLLRGWLDESLAQNERYTQLFDQTYTEYQLNHNKKDPIIVQMFLPPRVTAKIYERLSRIQEALEDPNVTPLELLLYVQPRLGRHYESIFASKQTPQQRWQLVKKGNYTTSPSGCDVTQTTPSDFLRFYDISPKVFSKLNPAIFIKIAQGELTKIDTQKGTVDEAREQLIKGDLKLFKECLLDIHKERILKGFPFGKNDDVDGKVITSILEMKPSFRRLSLAGCEALTSPQAIEIFSCCPTLRRLDLSRCTAITDNVLWELSRSCLELRLLDLNACPSLTDPWWARWLTFLKLRHLSLKACVNLQRFGIYAPKLKSLDLTDCTSLTRLKPSVPNLRRLKLDGCSQLSFNLLKLIGKGLNHAHITAARCPSLQGLKERELVEKCLSLIDYPLEAFSKETLQALGSMINQKPSITEVTVGDPTAAEKNAIGEVLKFNVTIVDLDLKGDDSLYDSAGQAFNSMLVKPMIFGSGLKSIPMALKTNSSLNRLILSNNNIPPSGLCALVNGLKYNSTLKTLNLDENPLLSAKKSGRKALNELLKVNFTLTALSLSNAFIPISYPLDFLSPIKALAEVLETNSSLKALDLSENPLFFDGLQSLSKMLKVNSSLTWLNLSNSFIYEEFPGIFARDTRPTALGVVALGEALDTNSTLLSLDLSHNEIEEEGAQVLEAALFCNSSLTELNLKHNFLVRRKTRKSIKRSLARNKAKQSIQTEHFAF